MKNNMKLVLKAELDGVVLGEVNIEVSSSILELEREGPFGLAHAISEKLAPKLVGILFEKKTKGK